MEVGQRVTGTVKFVDRKGNPAKVDGVPVWNVSDASLVKATPSADGMSCEFEALAVGGVLVSLDADADLGAGVKTISGQGALNILEPEAVGVEISFGEPQDPA